MKITQKGEYYQISGISFQEMKDLQDAVSHRNGSLVQVGKDPVLEDLIREWINFC